MTNNCLPGSEKWGRWDMFALFAVLLFVAAIRLPTLFEPWGGDQGVYGHIANRMLDGEVPYRNLYTNTGYGLFFLYALFLKVFGNHMASIHIGDFLAHMVTVIMVYSLARLLFGKQSALIASLAAAVFGIGRAFSGLVDMKGAWGTYWQLAQRETFMTPLLTAAILCTIFAARRNRFFWCMLAGAAVGLAAVLKVTATLMLLPVLGYMVFSAPPYPETHRIAKRIAMCISAVLGFAAANLPFIFYFWQHGSLGTMYRAVFVHTSIYAKLTRGNLITNTFMGNTYMLTENLILWLLAIAGVVWLLSKQKTKETYLVTAWAGVTLLMVWGQGKFFGYHFLLILAPFSILAGVGMTRLLKTQPGWVRSALSSATDPSRMFLWIVLAGNLVFFSWNHYDYYRWHLRYLSGALSKLEYYEVFNEYPLHLYSFRADREIAQYLKQNANTNATLRELNGGGDTIVNYLSGLRTVTRFTSTWYLFTKQLYSDPLTTALRRELIEGIRSDKPDYVLLVYYTADQFRREFRDPQYSDVGELLDYLETHYTVERTFRDGRTLYRRL